MRESEINIFQFFFKFEILITRSFRNRYKISHNTESKIWCQLCVITFPAKTVKNGKTKMLTFYRMTSSILLQNFRVIALKLNKLLKFELPAILLLKLT